MLSGMTTSAPYYGDSGVMRTPPPDLPSLMLKERIVYLGLPLFSDGDTKRQLGLDVTELIIAQLLFLEFDNPDKPIYFYINSTGTSWYSGESIGFETEAFAICDTLRYVKPPVHTICIGQAMGTAAVILSAGPKVKGRPYPMPPSCCISPAAALAARPRTFRSAPKRCCTTSEPCSKSFRPTPVAAWKNSLQIPTE